MVIEKLKRNKYGFSLIELLVTVGLLGILAAVAIPNVVQYIGKGDRTAALEEEHTVLTAVALAMKEKGNDAIVIYDGIIPSDTSAEARDPARYLENNTHFKWKITEEGTLTPGEGNPLLLPE